MFFQKSEKSKREKIYVFINFKFILRTYVIVTYGFLRILILCFLS